MSIYDTYPSVNLIISFLTGILSGFGIGGGTLLIIYLVYFASIDQKTAQYINLVYFLPTAVGSMFPHIKNKRIDMTVMIPTAVSGVIFAILASYIVRSFDVKMLKQLFGILLIYIGIREVFAKK